MCRNWLVRLALLLALGGMIWGIRAGALWEPHEVTVAELARRIGLNLLGGARLSVAGADNSLPIRADLGRGELPFTSAALGFRLFGLSEWAGRLPLALWALGGIASLYAALRRLWDERVALYASLVLATTPLYFLQARALLGDAVTLATFAMAWSGLATACLTPVLSTRSRGLFALVGALGLYAGFWCRGPIVSVAVPALAVAASALSSRIGDRFARWLALSAGVIGVLAFVLGCSGLALAAETGDYSVFVGTALAPAATLPTFDSALGDLVHSAFPWSAAAPLALALVFRQADAGPRRAALNAAALGLGFSLAASGWLSASLGSQILPAACCFAVLLGVAFAELETGSLGSPLLGLTVAALGIIIGFDLREYPDKTLVGFGLTGVTLPESMRASSALLWCVGALVLAVLAVLCAYEREPVGQAGLPVFRREEYGAVLGSLQRLWDGNLVFSLVVLEAALVGFLLLSALSERVAALPAMSDFGSFTRALVATGAIGVPLLPLLPLGALLLRDLARVAFRQRSPRWRGLGPSRAQGLLLAFACVGGVASLGFYPAVARQLSPQEALERYRELRGSGEPLGIVGQRSEAARYEGAPDARALDGVDAAFAWLTGDGPRRWLVLRQGDLAELNSRYRELRHANLPVLDARSSELLLASNRRRSVERDVSPLAHIVLDAAPAPQHLLHAVLDEKLEVLGWSVSAQDGALVSAISPATTYRFSVYYKVLGAIRGPWQALVHLDGLQRRFNADHELAEGRYPLRLWRQGDVIVDTTELLLEPNFSPGAYRVYLGLFSGDRRLPVTAGPESDDRVAAGVLQVR